MQYPLTRHAERTPDHLALIGDSSIITYADLNRRSIEAAQRLSEMGCRPGDRVAIAAPNSLAWVICAHAIGQLGAVILPLDPRMTTDDCKETLRVFTPSFVLTDARAVANYPAVETPTSRVVGLETLTDTDSHGFSGDEFAKRDLTAEIDPHQLHSIILTSGSTGEARGVRLSMSNHLFSAMASAQNLGIDPDDRWLVNLPLHHISGFAIIMRAAFYGTTAVIQRGFDADATLATIERERITQLSLVPTTLRRLLAAHREANFPSSVRSVLIGGGPADEALLREARECGLPVLPTYGMTETASQAATLSPQADTAKFGTAGKPLAFCEVVIRDDDNGAVEQEIEGVICIRGPMVADGYWKSPDEADQFAVDGWMETRDIGLFDADGYLIVRGRKDNAIITGGKKVFPEEVENALNGLPGISRAGVCGIDDPEWGQMLVAIVESNDEDLPDDQAIRQCLAGRLAAYKIPRRYFSVEKLPLTAAGKIDRKKLGGLCRTR